MKYILSALGLLLLLPWNLSRAADDPMRAAADLMSSLEIRIDEVTPSGVISLEMTNRSKEPLRIWKDGNSWGAMRWRVFDIRGGRIKIFGPNPYVLFNRNVPEFLELSGTLRKRLDLNDGWAWLEGPVKSNFRFEPGDMVLVAYDVPPTHEAGNMHVWYGTSAAIFTIPSR